MARQKKQYPPIEGQKWWEKVLDKIMREENFKWSIFSLVIYVVLFFISVYIPANILERPDIADILFEVFYGALPFVIAIAFINPLGGLRALWVGYKFQAPIKSLVEQLGSCTYSELVSKISPIKIHQGVDDALEFLLRSHELVLENDRYRLPTSEDKKRWRKEFLLACDVRISFEELENLFAMEFDDDEWDTSIGFSLINGGDYHIWKETDEISGETRFFFCSERKDQRHFSSFQELSKAPLFDSQDLRSVWNDAVITFFNDHEDIEWWLEKYLY